MLSRALSVCLISLGLLSVVGCGASGNPHENLANRGMAIMDQTVATFASIKDEASAKAAMPKLEKFGEQMKALAEEGRKLGEPSAELKAKIEAMTKTKSAEFQAKMTEFTMNMMRNPKLMETIAPIMQKFSQNQ